MHTPVLRRQCNGTDCGIFTLLYQQTVSNWYGTAAGQTFTDAHIQELINSLCTINQDTASRHREWIRNHMLTWWMGNWEGADPVTPTGTHQRQVQRRCHRCRVQESCIVEYQSSNHSATQSADSDTTRLEEEPRTSIAATRPLRRKRNVQEMDAEEQADRAANEIVDLVEQEVQRSTSPLTGSRHIAVHSIATDTTEQSTYAGQEEAIPEWVITESREMNREVTPPV